MFAEQGWRGDAFPVSRRLASEVLSLPIFPGLTRAEVERVASAILAFYGETGQDKGGTR